MTPIATALCSYGMSGKVFHAPFLHLHPGFKLHSVWERSKQEAAERYPEVKSVSSLDALLQDDDVELVVVNTPNYTHFEYAKKALEAGKHVIVEKPFTTTVAEAMELSELAVSKGKVVAVYHNRRWDSDFLTVRQVVQEGLLGDVVEASISFDRYKEALSPKLHKEIAQPGTGVLYDLGSHLIDSALQLFGFPEKVFADIRIIRPISQVDDYFEVLLYYAHNLRVRLHSSYLVREGDPGFILHGSKGSFLKSRTDVQEAALLAGRLPEGTDWGREPEDALALLHTEVEGVVRREAVPILQGNYHGFFTGVYEAVRNGAASPVSALEGAQVIKIIEAAIQSSREERIVAVQ
jgi:scyllo-inositol 2-dehydrogenase (NADP+)